jgi:predicted tellurium resistance membrane protein TerC
MLQMVLIDVSLSLDNVLAVAVAVAVAGAGAGSIWVRMAGLAISVILMGVAAGLFARLLEQRRWIAWMILAFVLYVALHTIWGSGHELVRAL